MIGILGQDHLTTPYRQWSRTGQASELDVLSFLEFVLALAQW
jgi:hypothetical protein